MAFDAEAVIRTAHLARISLPTAEVPAVAEQLERIMEMVEALRNVSTEGVGSMAHPLDLEQPLRPDIARNPDRREALMQNAPAARDGLFLVPKVIE